MKASTGEVEVCPGVGIKYRRKAAVGRRKLIRDAKFKLPKVGAGQ
jgi:hypothetical protein